MERRRSGKRDFREVPSIMRKEIPLLLSTFLISTGGLVYELLTGTISSYLLGDSIYQFSIVIGLFMSSMGIGAWLSRFIITDLARTFVLIQLGIALAGGFGPIILFYAFAVVENYDSFLYLDILAVGTMIGMEIPLVVRMLKENGDLRIDLSNVFTLDYIGALAASLLFPMILLPKLGTLQTGLFFGAMNCLVATMIWYVYRESMGKRIPLYIASSAIAIAIGFVSLGRYSTFIEHRLYEGDIIYSADTPYQHLTITRNGRRTRFYINGALQFDSLDEYRYHEALVHPAMTLARRHEKILVAGGGDGLAVREILKYGDVGTITLVDLDPSVTRLFSRTAPLTKLNHSSLLNEKVDISNTDIWKFIEKSDEIYDVIIVDLPDPDNISLSRLYSRKFYTMLSDHLSADGIMVIQSTSPLYARKAFWCIVKTIEATGLETAPYHLYIPSFGEWGFTMASHRKIAMPKGGFPANTRYLTPLTAEKMTIFAPDISRVETSINTILDHPLLHYYEEGWSYWYE
jgi:spermidine synthase